MANYHKELAKDVVCQSHTSHRTGLWFLPTRPLRLNTNDDNEVTRRYANIWDPSLFTSMEYIKLDHQCVHSVL